MVEALPGQAYWQGLFSSTKRKLSEPAIFTARPKSRMLKKKEVKIKIKKPKKTPQCRSRAALNRFVQMCRHSVSNFPKLTSPL